MFPDRSCECRGGQGERETEGRRVRVLGTTLLLVVRQLTFVEAGRVDRQLGSNPRRSSCSCAEATMAQHIPEILRWGLSSATGWFWVRQAPRTRSTGTDAMRTMRSPRPPPVTRLSQPCRPVVNTI